MENTMSNKRKKTAKQSKEVIIAPKKTDWWQPVLFILAGLLIFYPPLFSGLFFNQQMFVSHIITSIVFSLVLFYRISHKDYVLLRNPLDWAILAYAGGYLLSLVGAVHQGDAIYGFLKALNYFMVYWVVTRVASSYSLVREMLKFLLAGGLVVALIGILAAIGYSDYPGAYVSGAIMSTLQYSNTMAAYLAVMVLVGITLVQQEKSIWLKTVYSLANYFMVVAILGALSKGAWIILVGGTLLVLIGMPGMHRLKSLYYIGLAIGAAVMVYPQFAAAIVAADANQAWVCVGLGILLAGIGVIVWEGLEKLWKSQRLAPVIITVTVAALAVAGILALGNQVVLSDDVAKEISGLLNLESSSYTARAEFMRCAVEIVKDHPIIGAGAGGWEALYRQYQNYSYWTTETHSHFLQVWVETGTVGLLAFLAMWLILFFYVIRIYKAKRKEEDKSHWILSWGIASGALALGAHAAIDFDLSIPAMCMVLWSLLALVNSLYNESFPVPEAPSRQKPTCAWAQMGGAGLLVMLLLVSGGRYLYAMNQAGQAEKAILELSQETDARKQVELLNQASLKYNQAVKSDPCNGHYLTSLTTVYTNIFTFLQQQGLPEADQVRRQAVKDIDRAGELRPYDIKSLTILIDNAARLGHTEGLISLGQKSIKASPNDIVVYKNIANLWWDASQQYLEAGREDVSIEFAHQIQILEKSLLNQIAGVNIEHPYWVGPRLQIDTELQNIFDQADDYLNQNEE